MSKKKIILIVIIVLVVLGIIGNMSDSDKQDTSSNTETSTVQEQEETKNEDALTQEEPEEQKEEATQENTASQNVENSEEDFAKKYDTDIVVAAKMTLDNYIAGYDISLAPQKWTISKFDDTDTAIAMTDITYNNQVVKYIYVGTLNFNASGKVESATPHYVEVGGNVLGNDGYCDGVLDNIRALSGE